MMQCKNKNIDHDDNDKDNDVASYPVHVGWPGLSRLTVKGFSPGGDNPRLRKVYFANISSGRRDMNCKMKNESAYEGE